MQGAVWLITGAQASGKSTVAELLAQKFERGVHVRGGQFYRWAVRGWGHFDDPERAEEARRLLDLRFTPNNALCVLRIRLGSDFGYSRDQEAAIKPLLATHSDGEGRLREAIRRLGREATVDTQ